MWSHVWWGGERAVRRTSHFLTVPPSSPEETTPRTPGGRETIRLDVLDGGTGTLGSSLRTQEGSRYRRHSPERGYGPSLSRPFPRRYGRRPGSCLGTWVGSPGSTSPPTYSSTHSSRWSPGRPPSSPPALAGVGTCGAPRERYHRVPRPSGTRRRWSRCLLASPDTPSSPPGTTPSNPKTWGPYSKRLQCYTSFRGPPVVTSTSTPNPLRAGKGNEGRFWV